MRGQQALLAGAPRWSMLAPLASARVSHTMTLLPSGKLLVVGGESSSGYLASAELYDSATGTWTSTGSLAQGRRDHTATLLPSGKVLVVGGYGTSGSLASAEVYDPATGTWTATGWLTQARSAHTATLLPSGQVLVVGGYGSFSSYLATAEVYDPVTGSWAATGSLAQARRVHTATLLPSGQVLVVGGEGSSDGMASAEVYDPATGGWAATGSLAQGRRFHTATLLPSGRVLVSGGEGLSGSLASAEVYDPATSTWTPTGSLTQGRFGHTATLLPSGKVLAVGGFANGSYVASAELHDPAASLWTATAELPWGRYGHKAALLPSGQVLVAGGAGYDYLADAQLYDPATGTWAATGSLAQGRYFPTLTLLPSGQVLATGGYGATGYLSSAELYDPATGAWTATAPLAQTRYLHTATLLPSGKVLVVGGEGQDLNGQRTSAELYDPAKGTWTPTGSLSQARSSHTATLLPSGQVLVVGGYANNVITSAELYDPTTGTWTATTPLAQGRYLHTATLLPSGKVLVAGGTSGSDYLASAELYDPATGTWTATGSLAQGRFGHTATLLPSGQVLVASGADGSGGLSSERYDPATGAWTTTAAPAHGHYYHTATLLPSSQVLITGGFRTESSSELYDDARADPASRPGIISVSSAPLQAGSVFTVDGSLLRGLSEASDGSSHSSSTDFPILTLLDLERGRLFVLPLQDFSSTHVTARVPVIPSGQYLLAVTVNGVSSGQVVAIAGGAPPPDITPPTATLTAPAAGAVLKGTVYLSATAGGSFPVTRVEFYDGATLLGSDTAAPFSLFWNTKTAANGPRLLTVKAYDTLEQVGTSPGVSVTVNNDVSPPTVAFSSPTAGATVVGTITLAVTATDNVGVTRVEFYEGDTLLGPDTSAPYNCLWNTRTGPNGDRTLRAKAYDAVGNTSVAELTVTANNDYTAPTVTLTAPAEGGTVSGTVVLTATASDDRAVSKVAFFVGATQVGTDTTAPFSYSYNTRNLPNGTQVLTAKAYDAANNVGISAPVNVTFDNDFTPPTVTLTAPGEGETLTGTVVFTATASDDRAVSKVVFFIGTSQVGTDTTAPFSYSYNTRNMPNGAKVLTAKAYDAVSNVGTSAPVNVTFDNDFTPPTTAITSPASGSTLSGVVQIDAVASDDRGTITKVEFYQGATLLGTDSTAPYSWAWDTAKAPLGGNTLKTRAWDAAGNSAYGTAVTVTVTR